MTELARQACVELVVVLAITNRDVAATTLLDVWHVVLLRLQRRVDGNKLPRCRQSVDFWVDSAEVCLQLVNHVGLRLGARSATADDQKLLHENEPFSSICISRDCDV